MKRKNIISLSIAFAFLSLGTTGILLYIKQKPHWVEITHTIFGLVFIGFAVFHVMNNWGSIKKYAKSRETGKIQTELFFTFGLFAVVLVGAVTGILEPVAEAGRIFASARPRVERLAFDKVTTNETIKGTTISLMLEKNKKTEYPIIAVWVEDSTHAFVENLFVPAKIAKPNADPEEAKEGHFDIVDFNPDALPVWKAKSTNKKANFMKESPKDNFVLKTATSSKDSFYVLVEVNANGTSEVYQAKVDTPKSTIYKLQSKEGKLLNSIILEVK